MIPEHPASIHDPGQAISVQVEEHWQRDAIRLVPYRRSSHGPTLVGRMQTEAPAGSTPFLRMRSVDPETPYSEDDARETGIMLPLDVAQAFYRALGRYFGDHQDPASRELVDVLKASADREAVRADKLTDAFLEMAFPRTVHDVP